MVRKIFNGLDKFEEGFNSFILLTATFLLFVNVLLRYFFNASTSWAEEATRYLIIWISFVGGSICAKSNDHVSVDLLQHILPSRSKKILYLLSQFISTIFMAIFTYLSWQIMMFNFESGQISPALMIPMWIAYVSITLGSFLMAIRYLQSTIIASKNLFSTSETQGTEVKLTNLEQDKNII